MNELIDRLIAIKDQLNSQYNRDTINEVCKRLNQLDYFRSCKDCSSCEPYEMEGKQEWWCDRHNIGGLDPEYDGCSFYSEHWGERSVENAND